MPRTVTGVIRGPDGAPIPDFQMTFTVKRGQYRPGAHYPVSSVTATTDANGAFSIVLATDIAITVGLAGSFITTNSATVYPKGSMFDIVVPAGAGSIALENVRGLGGIDPDAPDVQSMLAAFVDAYLATQTLEPGPHTHPMADVVGLTGQLATITGDVQALDNEVSTTVSALSLHEARTNNPHITTAAQVGAYTIAQVDGMFGDLDLFDGTYSSLTGKPTQFPPSPHNHDGTYVKPGDLGSAAIQNSSAFATAAQGAKADTAVQPAALTSALASKADDTDLAALLTTAAAPEVIRDTMGTALVAGENVTITPNDGADTITIAASGGGVTVAGDGEAETASRSDHAHAGGAADSVTLRGTASAEGAVAIGIGAIADGDWSTALGNYSEAHGFGALAIHGVSTGEKSVAIGSSATAQNTGLAIGPYTSADASVAIGAAVSASAGGSAFGSSATASGIDSLALGSNASATGTRSIAIGSVTSSTANETAIGASTLRVAPAIGASTLQLRDGASAYHTVGVNTSAQITVDGNPVSGGGGNLVISDTAPTPAAGVSVMWLQTNAGGVPGDFALNIVTGE